MEEHTRSEKIQFCLLTQQTNLMHVIGHMVNQCGSVTFPSHLHTSQAYTPKFGVEERVALFWCYSFVILM